MAEEQHSVTPLAVVDINGANACTEGRENSIQMQEGALNAGGDIEAPSTRCCLLEYDDEWKEYRGFVYVRPTEERGGTRLCGCRLVLKTSLIEIISAGSSCG